MKDMFAFVECITLELLKKTYEFKFASPESKIVSISCRRFSYVTENEWTHLLQLRFIFFLLLKKGCSCWHCTLLNY